MHLTVYKTAPQQSTDSFYSKHHTSRFFSQTQKSRNTLQSIINKTIGKHCSVGDSRTGLIDFICYQVICVNVIFLSKGSLGYYKNGIQFFFQFLSVLAKQVLGFFSKIYLKDYTFLKLYIFCIIIYENMHFFLQLSSHWVAFLYFDGEFKELITQEKVCSQKQKGVVHFRPKA